MRTRRIAAGACALCLAIPAAAGASPAANQPQAPSVVVPPAPQANVRAKGPYGIVPPGPRSTVKAKGPYGIALSGPRVPTRGVNAPLHQHQSAAAALAAAGTLHHHGMNGWRAAAVAEAALLAALALGWTLVLPARRRPPRLVT